MTYKSLEILYLHTICTQYCHFDGGEISASSSAIQIKKESLCRIVLRRFLLRRNDKFGDNRGVKKRH